MTEPDFELAVEIEVDRKRLHGFLCDLEHYVPLHPLIESIVEIEQAPELPGARRWRVVDRVPLGPLRLRTVYVAALEPVSDVEIRGHAWQSPGVRLTTVYALSDVPGAPRSTRLEERVHVSAPFGLKRFVTRQARASHATTLARLKTLLEQD